ncbi:MAG: hypothetical protein HY051_03245 [Candidatus Aenigmarchaeota archaeon]|nr:hypothetical protein [Candidatus Aenigmarchaeota archaeon]
MKAKAKINQVVDRIADEVVELAVNSGKIADILIEMDQNKETIGQLVEENKKLRERIIKLEKRLDGQVSDFKTDVTEVDRAISERWQQFEDERNQDIMSIISQIQSLRDNLIKTRIELKRNAENGVIR